MIESVSAGEETISHAEFTRMLVAALPSRRGAALPTAGVGCAWGRPPWGQCGRGKERSAIPVGGPERHRAAGEASTVAVGSPRWRALWAHCGEEGPHLRAFPPPNP